LGNDLFVGRNQIGTVGEYSATTGAAINANFITGPNDPYALASTSVPEAPPWSMLAIGGVELLGMMLRKKHHAV
jgi:hypothetical protein